MTCRHWAVWLMGLTLAAGCATGGTAPPATPASSATPAGVPDFSGTWRLDTAGAAVRGGGAGTGRGTGQGGGLGLGPPPAEMTIRQTATTLEVRYSDRSPNTYRLDGVRTENPVAVGGGATTGTGAFDSRWQKGVLVTTFTVQVGAAAPLTYREARSIAADGRMIVDVALLSAPGRAGPPGSGRQSVYRRVATAP